MLELVVSQNDLVRRTQVSKTIVGELRHNIVQRQRSPRTLEALSIALAWHPQHLEAILTGRRPPQANEPVIRPDHAVPDHLASIERRLRQITDRLDAIDAIRDQLGQISADLSSMIRGNDHRE